jgi:hypothetical protein
MNITRTTNPNGTYRYTITGGDIIIATSKRRSEWGTIYCLSQGFGTNNTGDITATTHARQDLAAKGSRDLTRAGWVIIAVVQIINGDTQQATEEEQSPTSDQATTDGPSPTFQALAKASAARAAAVRAAWEAEGTHREAELDAAEQAAEAAYRAAAAAHRAARIAHGDKV